MPKASAKGNGLLTQVGLQMCRISAEGERKGQRFVNTGWLANEPEASAKGNVLLTQVGLQMCRRRAQRATFC